MRRLISDTRLPDSSPVGGASWDYGVDLEWLKTMRNAWLNDFDWKLVEKEMNSIPQFTAVIESVSVHFMHQKSSRADAVPILFLHGWPGEHEHDSRFIFAHFHKGSFWEFHRVVEMLRDPPADQPAFHIVVPSLPGFAFSSAPPRKGWDMEDNARIFDHLMTGVLGYSSYMVQGGDWGSLVSLHLGTDKFPACKLLEITAVPGNPTLGALLTLPFFLLPTSWRSWLYSKIYTAEDIADLSRSKSFITTGSGYFVQQLTRPFTIGYALNDSPLGILAWIGEKYRDLLDPEVLPTATKFILTTVSLYYLTNSFATSTLPYHENTKTFSQKIRMTKPYVTARYPYDVTNFPKGWIKAQHPRMLYRRIHQRGGHFPGFETPDLLAADLWELVTSQRALFG